MAIGEQPSQEGWYAVEGPDGRRRIVQVRGPKGYFSVLETGTPILYLPDGFTFIAQLMIGPLSDTHQVQTVRLRPATIDDAEMLLVWRNDPLTRAASINSDPVELDAHLRWLAASLQNPARDLLIAEEGCPVGTVRLDRSDHTEMSWTVAPEARGRGVGTAMVKAAMPGSPVIAHIKAGNLASRRIAAAAGFRLVEDGELQRWEANASQ